MTDEERVARAKARFRPLHEMVAAYMACAVRLSGGNLDEAARLLGIGRSTLYKRHRVTETAQKARIVSSGRRLKRRLDKLRAATDVAVENSKGEGAVEYDLGMANGLVLARHIMEGRTGKPSYL